MDVFTILAVAAIILTVILGFNKRFSYVQMLIFGNLVIFILTLLNFAVGDDALLDDLGFRPIYLTNGLDLYTIGTYMFVHAGFFHIIGNILFLFLIGVQLEYRVGKPRTVLFYFVAGVGAAIAQALILGLDRYTLMVGASGAIAGLIGAMLWLYPRDRIPMMVGPIFLPNVPVVLGVGVWLAMQLFLDLTSSGGGVAYAAHLAGFVIGIALAAVVPKAVPRSEQSIDAGALEDLAVTKRLKDDLQRIKEETEPAVRQAWLEHFVKEASCPRCGSKLHLKGNKIKCDCGYETKVR
ncbi:MAG TPA: rhomboid family intramembrane serine protease [Methanomassiliicoccales archaeon]|nr:rhomboid family intramembrane serine protease [Methanomassiliicoccales archaeon]